MRFQSPVDSRHRRWLLRGQVRVGVADKSAYGIPACSDDSAVSFTYNNQDLMTSPIDTLVYPNDRRLAGPFDNKLKRNNETPLVPANASQVFTGD